MEEPSSNPMGERTPLLQRQDAVDGPKRQQQLQHQETQAKSGAADTESMAKLPTRDRTAVQDCPDSLELIQVEAHEIVELVLNALSKVRQVPPQSSTEREDIVESETITSTTAVTTSCMPPAAARTQGGASSLLMNREEVRKNNINIVVDAVVAQLLERPEIRVLIDPLKIEEPISIDENGNFVDHIVVTGLTSFGRTADAILSVLDDMSIMIEVGLGVQKVHTSLEYKYKLKCCFPLTGVVDADLDGAAVLLKINVNGFTTSLISLDVNFGDPEIVNISGISPVFNWLAKMIVNKVLVSRKEEIRQKIVTKGSQKLGEFIDNMDLIDLIRSSQVQVRKQ